MQTKKYNRKMPKKGFDFQIFMTKPKPVGVGPPLCNSKESKCIWSRELEEPAISYAAASTYAAIMNDPLRKDNCLFVMINEDVGADPPIFEMFEGVEPNHEHPSGAPLTSDDDDDEGA